MNKAKEILIENGFTCVIYGNDKQYTSTMRGVRPLLNWYEEGIKVNGFAAADKVVGKATAFLYLLLEIDLLYARVISEPALELLQQNSVKVEYETLTKNIINRKGDGICPFEEAVLGVTEPQEAYDKICQKMKEIL